MLLPLQCLPATPTGQHPLAHNEPNVPVIDNTANNSGEEEQLPPPPIEDPAPEEQPEAPIPSPRMTSEDLAQELTCGDAGREEAAAVAIAQAISTTGGAVHYLHLRVYVSVVSHTAQLSLAAWPSYAAAPFISSLSV